jgi:sulfur carrier protein
MAEQAQWDEQIEIQLNGKATALPAGRTVADFLAARGLQDRLVVVELNGEILARSAFVSTVFNEGDRVEVVHFVGGG